MSLLGYILGSRGQVEITNSLEDLERVAREFRDKGVQILAINGGDGTVCRTLSAFLHAYREGPPSPLPKIALLRGGTINVLANNLGIRGSPEQVLYRLVEWHASGEAFATVQVPSIEIDGNFGFLFATGAAPAFLKEYYQRKSSPLGAFLLVLAVWASRFWGSALHERVVRDHLVSLTADGAAPINHSTCAVFSSTLRKLPLGYPLFELTRPGASTFQTVSFTFAARDAVWQFPLTLVKRIMGLKSETISLTCRDLVIAAERPFDYTLDGELYVSRSSSLRVQLGPNLEFVTI